MGLFKSFVRQTRKPEGLLGKMMLSGMNSGHAKLADWGFAHLPAITPEKAVDLGCGGGRNAGELLNLRLAAEAFDLATAFETIYFWPGIERCFAQVAKILKPGGTFMICNESDGMDPTSLKYEKIIDGMKNHTVEEIESALKAAGFSEVMSDHHPSKPWITVLAKK